LSYEIVEFIIVVWALAELNRKSDAIVAFLKSRQLFQKMELDEYVKMADNAIQQIEANSTAPSNPNRSLLKIAINFLWQCFIHLL
jgi:hypothetical protein